MHALRRALYSAIQLVDRIRDLRAGRDHDPELLVPVLLVRYTGGAELDPRSLIGRRWLTLCARDAGWSRWCSARRCWRSGLSGVYLVPRLLQPVPAARTRPTSLYGVPLLGPRHRRGVSNSPHLQSAVRRQLVHRPLPASWIGWNLNKIEQTGSNFGTNQKHDNPFLCDIGSGTMVSDGLSMINVADVEHVVQAQQGEDRRPQLSRQQHPLSGRRQDRRRTACSAPR